ncbi:MAG: adenylosuccinate lyase [Candidatus Aenigmatarchaeota archaeon]
MVEKSRTTYVCPLGSRYAKKMGYIFSDEFKHRRWRKCWHALAESQYELGIGGVTKKQVDQMKSHLLDINYTVAEAIEKEKRHDVMAYLLAYAQQCPDAAPIMHLGATSCLVADNTELMQMHAAKNMIKRKLVNTISNVRDFSIKYKDLPILGFTHFQPAQPTTLGKRAATWCQDLVLDYREICNLEELTMLRGAKGTTGTQASYFELADGDEKKVKELNQKFVEKLGYKTDFPITTQTYPRKYDSIALNVLAGIGESAHKAGLDIRLLQNRREMEESFGKDQVGSSTMMYKRNPMKSERMCGLSREVIANSIKPRMTEMTQILERSLDDSSPRRIYIPESFMAADEVLNLYMNIMEEPVVYPKVIARNLNEMMPFIATENILMAAVKRGGNRQELHEIMRQHSQEASRRIKKEGKSNELLEMLAKDPKIGMTLEEIKSTIDVKEYIGRAPQLTEDYMKEVKELLDYEESLLGLKSKVEV